MAIDTANKRASAMNPGCPWRGLWPRPDGTVSAGDRAQADFMYRGIVEPSEGGGAASTYIPTWRRRRR